MKNQYPPLQKNSMKQKKHPVNASKKGLASRSLRFVLFCLLFLGTVHLVISSGKSGAFAFVPVSSTATSSVVISQVYGGGGNSGATYTHDFIELFNASYSSVNLNGWSVQYASASGDS